MREKDGNSSVYCSLELNKEKLDIEKQIILVLSISLMVLQNWRSL